MAKRYDPILCMMVEEGTKTTDASPGWVVDYVSGYAGNGVNNMEREVFRTEQEARKRANELKNKGIVGIKVWRHSSMYNDSVIDRAIKTMDAGGNFYGIYMEGRNRLDRTDNMGPRQQSVKAKSITEEYVNKLDSEYNKISNEYSKYRNELRKYGEGKEMDAVRKFAAEMKKDEK